MGEAGTLYNEIEPFAVQWLRNLSDAGHIAAGTVEPRSIVDLRPSDVASFTQFHAFAGIGVWSYALRLAGWPDDAPVWTGSCPCQPFSGAGAGAGFDDPRHLWPEWFRLIRECRPPVVFGEQVEGKAGRRWLDLVSSDLEGVGYAFGAAVLPAAGVGAPHLRHRTFFVAYAPGERWDRLHALLRASAGGRDASCVPQVAGGGAFGRLGNAHGLGAGRDAGATSGAEAASSRRGGEHRAFGDFAHASGGVGELGDPGREGLEGCGAEVRDGPGNAGGGGGFPPRGPGIACGLGDPGGEGPPEQRGRRDQSEGSPTSGFWGDAEWIPCRDGKWRPVEPGSFPLAHGATNRVGRLRGTGNAITAQVAAEFIGAFMEAA